MKLKEFYRRVREVESGIEEAFPLIASLPTSDGGRPGVITEVTRAVAARFIAEGRSRIATAEEAEQYRASLQKEIAAVQEEEARRKVAVTLISEADLREIKNAVGIKK